MVHCVAYACTARSDNGNRGFFLFPKDLRIRDRWVKAINSYRNIGGKLVKFKPSSTSRVCKRHFADGDFVHPPSVMKSVGVELKLILKQTAVPSVFLEVDECKERARHYSAPLHGPVKRKRKTYGAFEKRNKKAAINEIIQSQGVSVEQIHEEQLDGVSEMATYEFISGTIFHAATLVSQASQTTERMVPQPTEHKSFGTQRTDTRDTGMSAGPVTIDTACGPECAGTPVNKCFQFPEETGYEVFEEQESDQEDDTQEDPDWEPNDEVLSSDEEGEDLWYDCTDQVPRVERKFVVFETCLQQLFLLCQLCGSACTVLQKRITGSMLTVITKCQTGHQKTWCSQPVVNGTPLFNLLAAGGITFSGASARKVINMFEHSGTAFITGRTFSRIQRAFVLPSISNVWREYQSSILQQCRGRPVKVGGDARCCSPGHTAKYGSYTLMDLETGQVLAVELVQSNEVKNSNAMELEGLRRGLNTLERSGVEISDITTDRHLQVRKYLREEQPSISHWFDGWHLAKNIKKKLLGLGRKKGCEIVGRWAQSISNHLYFCAASSGGDGDEVEAKWLSILNHVADKHEGHSDKFPRCLHGPLERQWIKEGSKAHKELRLIIDNKRLLTDIRKLSPAEQTSTLVAQHKVVCQFAPKFVHFSYASMRERLHLAALHTCFNAGREQAATKAGQLKYRVSYPKYKAGNHVVKPILEDCSYEYVERLNMEMVDLRNKFKSYKAAEAETDVHKNTPLPLSSTAKKVRKSDAIISHKSRFSFTKTFPINKDPCAHTGIQ